jgi:2-oxoglutarate dehydrogenase E2 component (dihydrolipoamide succinyltransferase)
MAQLELIMPKMGESIMEATILRWVKKEGDRVEADETVLEIATDKVDSEVPSPYSGIVSRILYKENDVVQVGKPVAIITSEGEADSSDSPSGQTSETYEAILPAKGSNGSDIGDEVPGAESLFHQVLTAESAVDSGRFYSPLVRNIAKAEKITMSELEMIAGSGQSGRVTKKDILAYVQNRKTEPQRITQTVTEPSVVASRPAQSLSGNVEIIEMDRMRKLIAEHMVMSKRTSPHVTSFCEVDVTNIVNWREKVKDDFLKKHGEKITFTPIFIEATVKAIVDFPMINISVEENRILVKKQINIGMATALPSGNLIVPVIKNANQLNLIGLTKAVNELAGRAREGKLKPEEIQDGTFTLTNVGTFGNVMGTPIINQPQVAIMATGAIRKKPAVVETQYGDLIAVRQMMFLSLSYDHRVVDGFLGGSFLRKVADYLEAFDPARSY